MGEPPAFVSKEEECTVTTVIQFWNEDGSVELRTELILVEWRRRRAQRIPERVAGVKCVVANELPCATVKLVTAAFGHHADNAPEDSTVLGSVIMRLHLELLYSVNDGRNHVSARI